MLVHVAIQPFELAGDGALFDATAGEQIGRAGQRPFRLRPCEERVVESLDGPVPLGPAEVEAHDARIERRVGGQLGDRRERPGLVVARGGNRRHDEEGGAGDDGQGQTGEEARSEGDLGHGETSAWNGRCRLPWKTRRTA